MTLSDVADVAGAALVLLGAFLCFAAAVGLARFPDVLSRMHAATKPQTLGLILVAAGVELSLRTWAAFGTVVLIAALQLATAPVAAHLVGRTVYRSNQVRHDLLGRDDLADDLAKAGFRLGAVDQGNDSGQGRRPSDLSDP
jgi:multicomponent Na+:H+ antiporter subunit G